MNRKGLIEGAKKARKVFQRQYWNHTDDLEEKARALGIYRKTRCLCSSPGCCGNPRHARGDNPTIQERRQMLNEYDE